MGSSFLVFFTDQLFLQSTQKLQMFQGIDIHIFIHHVAHLFWRWFLFLQFSFCFNESLMIIV